MRFKELTEKQSKELILNFINDINRDIGSKLSKEDLVRIYLECYKWIGQSNAFTKVLDEIYDEIIENYKRYLPFCYASIRTAYRNINERKK